MEWTTQTEQQPRTAERGAYANGNDADPQSTQPLSAVPAPPGQHAAPVPQPAADYDRCPSCGAPIGSDQRYCLACGQRRGEPRLPFMDAVVFMDAMKQPPGTREAPAPKKRRKASPNAALIAGVGTLLLALGIGVLIGRSGSDTATAPQQAPIVIKDSGAGEAPTAKTTIGGGRSGAAGKARKATKAEEKEMQAAADSGRGAEEVLKPKAGVKLPPPTTGVGDKCAKGAAGCEHGKFTGNFFGE